MSSSYDYDTAAIRAQARQIRACREKLAETATPRLRTVQSTLEGNFIGRAAEALNERLESSRQELKRLEGELDMLCSSLNSYANALEEADRRAAQIMAGG